MRRVLIVFLLSLLLFAVSGQLCAEEPILSADDYLRSAEKFLQEGREFRAVEEFRKAIAEDPGRSEVYSYLAVLLYELGFIDNAVAEMRKAVNLSPDSVFLNMELGKLYFARNSRGDAMEQFITVLEMNPGHTNAYYYLGELFLRMKEYDMAWLSAKMARRMGLKNRGLIGKLGDLSVEPKADPWMRPGQDLYIRQILVPTREQADEVMKRIAEGELFEHIASREVDDPTGKVGGFLGRFAPSAVHPRIADELTKNEIFSGPHIVSTDKGFHIVQRIVPFDYNAWEELLRKDAEPEGKPAAPEKAIRDETEGAFIVFAGAFREEKNAAGRVADLRGLGYPSYYVHRGEWFTVIAGRYQSQAEALTAGKKIAGQGYEFYISEVK